MLDYGYKSVQDFNKLWELRIESARVRVRLKSVVEFEGEDSV